MGILGEWLVTFKQVGADAVKQAFKGVQAASDGAAKGLTRLNAAGAAAGKAVGKFQAAGKALRGGNVAGAASAMGAAMARAATSFQHVGTAAKGVPFLSTVMKGFGQAAGEVGKQFKWLGQAAAGTTTNLGRFGPLIKSLAPGMGAAIRGGAAMTAAVGPAMAQAFGAASHAMKLVTAGVFGFASAGLVGTAQGQQLALATQMLSREVAAVFLPTFKTVTNVLREVTGWFRSLSGGQQDLIGRFGEAGAAATAASSAFFLLTSPLEALNFIMPGLGTALHVAASAIGALVVGAVALDGGFEAIVGAMRATAKWVGQVADAVGQALAPAIESGGNALHSFKEIVWNVGAALGDGLGRAIVGAAQATAPLINAMARAVEISFAMYEALSTMAGGVVDGLAVAFDSLGLSIERAAMAAHLLLAALSGVTGVDLSALARIPAAAPAAGKPREAHHSVTQTAGRFEGAQESYHRIQGAVSQLSDPATIAKDQLGELKEIKEFLAVMAGSAAANGTRGAVLS